MIHEPEKINDLLIRFFEGQTTAAEEQTLYRYFSRDDLPADLAGYRPVFDYFRTGLAVELAAPTAAAAPRPPRRRTLTRLAAWAGMAAAAVAGCAVAISLWQDAAFDPYEGSYIVRDGVRITDTKRIRPELERTLREVQQQQADLERIFDEAAGPDDLFDRYRESIEQHQNAILSGFTDPYAREEARKLLTTNY
jgi:hypothetical protein